MKGLCSKRICTIAYHPEENGTVEMFHRTLSLSPSGILYDSKNYIKYSSTEMMYGIALSCF